MIKRIAILSLLLLYISTTSGFALNLHFCGTKVSDIRINHSAKKTCCKEDTESKPDTCCKDQHIRIKVSDQQQVIQSAKLPAVSDINLFILPENPDVSVPESSFSASILKYTRAPGYSTIPLNIQNCVFLI